MIDTAGRSKQDNHGGVEKSAALSSVWYLMHRMKPAGSLMHQLVKMPWCKLKNFQKLRLWQELYWPKIDGTARGGDAWFVKSWTFQWSWLDSRKDWWYRTHPFRNFMRGLLEGLIKNDRKRCLLEGHTCLFVSCAIKTTWRWIFNLGLGFQPIRLRILQGDHRMQLVPWIRDLYS